MASVLRKVRDYYRNPQDYADHATGQLREGEYRATMLSIPTICGIRLLGKGNFARTYQLNSRWVLKISGDVRGGDDVAYDEWAKYCMANPNRWVPRIRARITIDAGRGIRAYIIERLSEMAQDQQEGIFGRPTNATTLMLRKCVDDPNAAHCPELFRVLHGFGTANLNDIHAGNVMQRHNGQVVLTDPCHTFQQLGQMKRTYEDERRSNERRRREMGERLVFEPLPRRGGFIGGVLSPQPFRMQERNINMAKDFAQAMREMREALQPDLLKRKQAAPVHHRHLLEKENGRNMRRPAARR